VRILSAVPIAPAAWIIQVGGGLDPPDVRTEMESGRGLELIGRELPGQPPPFNLIFSSATLSAMAPVFRAEGVDGHCGSSGLERKISMRATLPALNRRAAAKLARRGRTVG
jgi:hypothetical protein